MLALRGFDAYGLEISETAVKEAEAYAAAEVASPSSYHFGEGQSSADSPGSVVFVKGDFFTSEWDFKGGIDAETKFDLAYDYTVSESNPSWSSKDFITKRSLQFLCALHPDQRKSWADRLARVLKPGGLLICLEFPMYKDPQAPGPPWGLKGVHWDVLALGGNGVVTGEVGDDGKEKAVSVPEQGEFRRILYVKPERSYEVAKGTDMVSVYERK